MGNLMIPGKLSYKCHPVVKYMEFKKLNRMVSENSGVKYRSRNTECYNLAEHFSKEQVNTKALQYNYAVNCKQKPSESSQP